LKALFTNKYFILLLVVTVLLLVLAALYTVDRQSVTFGEDVIGAVITPFQSLITAVSGGVGNFFGYFADMDALKSENARMSGEIDTLSGEIRKLEEHKLENERLRRMLALQDSMYGYTLAAAEVIAKDAGNWFDAFTINKGTNDGLAARMAVITTGGLVGHIYEIGANWAKVISIIDAKSGAGAVVVRTRDTALVESDAQLQQEGLCKMTYLPKSASVIPGDIIETSGLGGIYPKGLLIGKIREIRPETAGISQYAIIEPSADFERVSEVFVIVDYPSEPSGGAAWR
jgi:rod shape-determining protein MreC